MKKVLATILALGIALSMAYSPASADEVSADSITPASVTSNQEALDTSNTLNKIFDGDSSTTWGKYYKIKNSISSAEKGNGALVITMDLGRAYNLTEMSVAWGSCYGTGVALYGADSENGTWYEIGDYTISTNALSTFEISHSESYRYIKFEVYRVAYTGQVSITELSLVGTKNGRTEPIDNSNVTAEVNGSTATRITDGVNGLTITSAYTAYKVAYKDYFEVGDGTSEVFSVIFDLGAQYDVDAMFHRWGGTRMVKGRIYVSNDGVNWSNAVATIENPTYTGETTSWSYSATTVLGSLGGKYRYIKLEVTQLNRAGDKNGLKSDGVTAEDQRPSIYEIMFYSFNEIETLSPESVTASQAATGTATADKIIDGVINWSSYYKPASTLAQGDGTTSLVDITYDFGTSVNITEFYSQWGACKMSQGKILGTNNPDGEWTVLHTITQTPTYVSNSYGSDFTQNVSHDGYYRYIKLSITKLNYSGQPALFETIFKGVSDPTVAPYDPTAERTLTMAFDFNGTSLGSYWKKCPEGSRQDGYSYWDDDMVSLDGNGNLVLSAVWDSANNRLKTGAVRTQSKYYSTTYSAGYGYYEARIKFSQVHHGAWGAFWIMAGNVQSTSNGAADGVEIDIIETIGNDYGACQSALHWDGYGTAHQSTNSVYYNHNIYDGEYHTFGCERTAEGYKFFIDGELMWSVSAESVAACDDDGYLKLSVEAAEWAGAADAACRSQFATEQAVMIVDYVHVYED